MRLYIEGHNRESGYAISKQWSDAECSALPAAKVEDLRPVRFITSLRRAIIVIARWNRRFATH